ncbi:hypothetical protein C8Q75DRAFT_730248 [Abortiporus biennis]|nr:hypothetical protein C8Q75DRAFT_730248 [Abortiporus biennis]
MASQADSLQPGRYFITSSTAACASIHWLYTAAKMGPVPVMFLPGTKQWPDGWVPVWDIERKGQRYILRCLGLHITVIENKVFAIPRQCEKNYPPTEFEIVPKPEEENLYSIMVPDTGKGWVALGSIPLTQIEVRPHIVSSTTHSSQMFNIFSVDDE